MELLRLASSGKYGSLAELKQLPVREILQCLHFEGFLEDLENAYVELNREDR